MSVENRWTISSSYEFPVHLQRSQRCHFSQTVLKWFEVLPGFSLTLPGAPRLVVGAPRHFFGAPRLLVGAPRHLIGTPSLVVSAPRLIVGAPSLLPGAPRCSQTIHNHSHGTPVPVIGDPSHSEGRPECPPMVWHSPEIHASKFTLHIFSDTPGGSQWLKHILLMNHHRGGDRRVYGWGHCWISLSLAATYFL